MRNLKKILALVLALVMSLSLMATAGAMDWDDVEDDNDYATAIDILSSLGVFVGYEEDGTFRPDEDLTRAQAAVLVYRVATGDVEGKYVDNYTYMANSKFNDLDNGYSWAKGHINYCQNAGIIVGTSATTFHPGNKVTGYQLMVMMLRTLGYDKAGEFSDPVTWELTSASKCESLGMLDNIVGDGNFGAPATRAMTAEILFRAMLQNTVTYSVNTSGGYTSTGQTLGYREFGLEKLTGVVRANEYADIRWTKNADGTIKDESTPTTAGTTVLRLLDEKGYETKEDRTVYVSSTLDDLGESRTVYTVPHTGDRHSDSDVVREVVGLEDTGWNDASDAIDDGEYHSGLGTVDKAEHFLNFNHGTSSSKKTSITVTYRISKITQKVPAATQDIALSTFRTNHGISTNVKVTKVDSLAAATNLGINVYAPGTTNEYTFVYIPGDIGTSREIGINADTTDHTYRVSGNGYYVQIAANGTYTKADEDWIRSIFANGNYINGSVVEGEVYRGTQAIVDYSNSHTYTEFENDCITSTSGEFYTTTNNAGYWIKVIDYNDDGVKDFVFQTRYTVASVTKGSTEDNLDAFTLGTDTWASNDTADVVNTPASKNANEEGTPFNAGDVVIYATIDGYNRTWSTDVVEARVKTVDRVGLTITTEDGENFAQSAVHEHSSVDSIKSEVTGMAGTTMYRIYLDRFGYVAAYEQQKSGKFVLLTDGWAQTTKTGIDYAVKAWDPETKTSATYDITAGGNWFIWGNASAFDPNPNNPGSSGLFWNTSTSANSWNRIRSVYGLNSHIVEARETTNPDDIRTMVAYLETDSEADDTEKTGTLSPVDRVFTNKTYTLLGLNKTVPAVSGTTRATAYTSSLSAASTSVGNSATSNNLTAGSNLNYGLATPVDTLATLSVSANTQYLYVYSTRGDYAHTDDNMLVYQTSGSGAASVVTGDNRIRYVEDVYAIGTKVSDHSYVAEIVVVELNNQYYREHQANQQVFVYDFPTVGNLSSLYGYDTVYALDSTGNKVEYLVNLAMSGLYAGYNQANTSAAVGTPGLYYLHEYSQTYDGTPVYTLTRMNPDDVSSAGYMVGVVSGSYNSLTNSASVAYYGSTGISRTFSNVDGTSKYWNYSYSGGRGTLTEASAATVLVNPYAVMVRSSSNSTYGTTTITYAIRFVDAGAQGIWSGIRSGVPSGVTPIRLSAVLGSGETVVIQDANGAISEITANSSVVILVSGTTSYTFWAASSDPDGDLLGVLSINADGDWSISQSTPPAADIIPTGYRNGLRWYKITLDKSATQAVGSYNADNDNYTFVTEDGATALAAIETEKLDSKQAALLAKLQNPGEDFTKLKSTGADDLSKAVTPKS